MIYDAQELIQWARQVRPDDPNLIEAGTRDETEASLAYIRNVLLAGLIDHDTVVEVLLVAATSAGRTEWMQAVLGSSHVKVKTWALDNTEPGPDRNLLLRAGNEAYEQMVAPPEDLVSNTVDRINYRRERA